MKKKIYLTNNDLCNLVFESVNLIIESVDETKLIRPYNHGKNSPFQKDLSDNSEFEYYKQMVYDGEIDISDNDRKKLDKGEISFERLANKLAADIINSRYKDPDNFGLGRINKVQKAITNNIQNTAINNVGTDDMDLSTTNVNGNSLKDLYYTELKDYKEIKANRPFKRLKSFNELSSDFDNESNPEKFVIKTLDHNKLVDKFYIKNDTKPKLEVKGRVFGFGNTKLPPNILIINLTSAVNCPAAQECKFSKLNFAKVDSSGAWCYAQRDESAHPSVEQRNIRNEHMLKHISLKDLLRLIESYIENASTRIRYIRINESGDFQSPDEVLIADKLAAHLNAKYGISTSCYSNKSGLDSAFGSTSNLIFNASNPYKFKNATRYYMAISNKDFEKLPDVTPGVVHKRELPNGIIEDYFICECNCYACKFCYQTKYENSQMYGESTDNSVKTKVYAHLH